MKKLLAITAILSLALAGCGSTDEANTKESATTETKPVEVKEEVEAPKLKIEDVDLTSEAVTPILQDLIADVDKVEVTNGKVTVYFDADKTYWDEADVAKSTARLGVTLMEALFKNADVKSVELITPVPLMDNKGNETTTEVVKVTWDRAANDDINYKNFSDMMYVEFPQFYNVATSYYIHPAIFSKIKAEDLAVFDGGFQKE